MSIGEIHEYGLNVADRVIYIHAEFEPEEAYLDFRMASRFIKNLDYLNSISDKDITVKIISYGGCWNYGMAMFDAIKNSKSQVTTISYAHSRSMSSIVPQAAGRRLINKNCDFMIHFGTLSDDGDYRTVVASIDKAKEQTETMLRVYAERCVNGEYFKSKNMDFDKTLKFIRKKIEKTNDWFMTPEEAVYYGFMDEII